MLRSNNANGSPKHFVFTGHGKNEVPVAIGNVVKDYHHRSYGF